MAMNTDKLIEIYNEVLPDAFQEGSILAQAGTSDISWNTTDLTRVLIGAPSNVEEGGIKPLKEVEIDSYKVKEIKLAGILAITDEANDSPEGSEYLNKAIAQFIAQFPAAVDISVLAGTDPATGSAVSRYADVNLKSNANQFLSSDAASIDVNLKKARYATRARGSKILLSDEGHAQMSSLDWEQTGAQKYPQLDLANASFRGMPVLSSTNVGLDGIEAGDDIRNSVLAYLGPWGNISLAFQPITVKESDTAVAGGINAFETNHTLYRVEQRVKFYIHEPEKFSVVKDANFVA